MRLLRDGFDLLGLARMLLLLMLMSLGRKNLGRLSAEVGG